MRTNYPQVRLADVTPRDTRLKAIRDFVVKAKSFRLFPYAYGAQFCTEWQWLVNGRPYYKVHPSLLPAIESTKLDVTWDQAGFGTVDPIAIEFEHQVTDKFYLRSVLAAVVKRADPDYAGGLFENLHTHLPQKDGVEPFAAFRTDPVIGELIMIMDYNEKVDDKDWEEMCGEVSHSFLCVPIYQDMSLEERIDNAAYLSPLEVDATAVKAEMLTANAKGYTKEDADRIAASLATVSLVDPEQRKFTYMAMRALVMVLALRSNPDFVTPEVLAKDQAKFEATKDTKYVEKAKRNGKFGYLVGFNSAGVVPHLRRFHMAWRWYGPGKKQKRLVPIEPTIVRRDRLTEVPQGWHDELAKRDVKD